MAIDRNELDDSYRFVNAKADTNAAESLEEALRQFRIEHDNWQPQSAIGKRLKELRSKFLASGGELLSSEQINDQLADRRGRSLQSAWQAEMSRSSRNVCPEPLISPVANNANNAA